MGTILSGGKIVTPKETIEADIRFENGIIQAIDKNIKAGKNDEVINVKGSYILPGGIETHTHFYLGTGAPLTADDFKTGTLAAIAGGTTTILDFATQDKGKTLEEALDVWHKKAYNVSFCDYGFHMAITDWNEETSKSMENMIKSGISSFKMYMAYKGTLQVNDSEIYEALKRSKEINGIIGFHCENGDIIDELIKENIENGLVEPKYHEKSRPSILEAEAISRVSKIAKVAKAPLYIVHLSSKEGYKEALKAWEDGVNIYLETCPQYLLLDKSKYEGTKEDSFNGAKYVMSPPLRNKEDNEMLWKGIEKENIEIIGTDHCSFTYDQKKNGINDFRKIPNGGPGVEHRILLMYQYGVVEKRFSINKLSEIISTNAAKMFGMYPKKGIIKCGSDADLVVLNPNKTFIITKENQHQNLDYTPYDGYKIDCNIDYVFLRGENIVKDNELAVTMPRGKYIKRNSFKGL
ncbi:MAG: dihydropyrimidinase [Clostridium perfringens]|nr:dihydropyrimidinase [Clostridium perfringens]